MVKKKYIITACVLVLGILTIVLLNTFGTKPFAKLTANEVVSVELFVVPPETTLSLTDKEDFAELTDILNEIIIYREDNSGRDYDGQFVQVTITLKNGETHIISAYGSFLFLDGRCYLTKYEPSQKLNAFGNRILNER